MTVDPSWTSPVTTGNLVLKTRIALVIRSLELVQQALAAVREQRLTYRDILLFPGSMSDAVERLRSLAARIEDQMEDDQHELARGNVQKLQHDLTTLHKEIEELQTPADRLRRSIALGDLEKAQVDAVSMAIHESLKDAISTEFGYDLERLATLQQTVTGATPSSGASSAPLVDAWKEYAQRLYTSGERLFEEYVDLVSGVALRDTGFDRGISRLAEELLKDGRTIGSFTWNALTIPAREEALEVTAARIVRLGFPEWTIWTLPLAAYELGSNYADYDKKVADRINWHGGEADELMVLVADAFATYLLGPAYACAAILMRLDPADSFDERRTGQAGDDGNDVPSSQRLAAKRAAIILRVLQRMSVGSGVSNVLAAVIGRLADEWAEALRQNGWEDRLAASVADAAAEDDDDALQLRRRSGLTAEETTSIDKLVMFFEPLVQAWIVFDVDMWPQVEIAAQKLRDGQALDEADLPPEAQQRFLVNAAWRARIAAVEGEKDVEEPRRLTAIAKAVEDHMQDLILQSGVGGDPAESLRRNPRRSDARKYGNASTLEQP